ncbi:hypothetical protein HPP92_022841 [Vanilla planifolia]|uniref:Uncharacterized protein n=1 Tax=Vanilla planifolia TaxID=51239 RepID=A0A835UFT0_VANPL|nr:hypothetical protein HPP92_023129 [Vanilla planifolia]KAG0459713.1 hypothetical protein HPP92_022841 [Vanilla planifolia]
MVISAGEDGSQRKISTGLAEKTMNFPPSRRSTPQSRLHNFSFPTLSWGNQKLLRCVNLSGGSMDEEIHLGIRLSSSDPNAPPLTRILPQKRRSEEDDGKESNRPSGTSASRPWNLRSRRAACNAPAEIGPCRNSSFSTSLSPSPSHSPLQKEKSSCEAIIESKFEGLEMIERRKFSVALSREEIEADFLAVKGAKPPRRPKKRAKYLQRQID